MSRRLRTGLMAATFLLAAAPAATAALPFGSVLEPNAPGVLDVDLGPAQYVLPVGDVDGDGRADLAVADASGELTVRTGPQGRGFRIDPGSGAAVSAGGSAGDVNGDGLGDMFLENGVQASVLFGHRGSAPVDVSTSPDVVPFTVAGASTVYPVGLGDVNGDRRDDIAISAYGETGPRSWIVFGPIRRGPVDPSALPAAKAVQIPGGPGAKSAGDVNGDGIDDILGPGNRVVFGARHLTESDLSGPGSRGFAITYEGQAGAALVAVGDVNCDGRDDISAGSEHVTFVPPSIVFGKTSSAPVDVSAGPPSVAHPGADFISGSATEPLGDVDGDGRADVVVRSTVYRNPVDGLAPLPGVYPDGVVVRGAPAGALAPFTDPFVPAGRGFTVQSRSAVVDTEYGTQMSSGAGILRAAGDVDGDGLDDILVATNEGYGIVFGGRGAGDRTTPQVTITKAPADLDLAGTAPGELRLALTKAAKVRFAWAPTAGGRVQRDTQFWPGGEAFIQFDGKGTAGGPVLAPGRWSLSVTPYDAAGRVGPTRTAIIRVHR
ncbi:MAG: VCBS repeat-containing protein [Solirubrobacteraceae bacterium]|nr:VCBS repeat-containing protein [Solirubrobacteraceae bacterium]